jgi:hypothetical protein
MHATVTSPELSTIATRVGVPIPHFAAFTAGKPVVPREGVASRQRKVVPKGLAPPLGVSIVLRLSSVASQAASLSGATAAQRQGPRAAP